jgi:hypothetical protein
MIVLLRIDKIGEVSASAEASPLFYMYMKFTATAHDKSMNLHISVLYVDNSKKILYNYNIELLIYKRRYLNKSNSIFRIKDGILENYTGNDFVVTIPNGVSSIDEGAFWVCSSLKEVNIPESVHLLAINFFTIHHF